jgi:hypothetical protein
MQIYTKLIIFVLVFQVYDQVYSQSFSIPFMFNTNTNHWIKIPTTFHPIYEEKQNQPELIEISVDINLMNSFVINNSANFRRSCFKMSNEIQGVYEGASLTGFFSEAKVSFGKEDKSLYWDEFPIVFIVRYSSLPSWKEVFGLGYKGIFYELLSKKYSSKKYALDFHEKKIFGGKDLDDIINNYNKQIGYCSFPEDPYGGATFGWRCNLEYVIIKKDEFVSSKDEIIKDNKSSQTQINYYIDEIEVYSENTNIVNNRFETIESSIKAPIEFIDFLKKKYFVNKNCVSHILDGKPFFVCDEKSYNKCSDITFVFGNYALAIKKEKLFYSIGNSYVFLIGENTKLNEYKWVFGNLFLKNVITVFNADEDKIHFIPIKYKEGETVHKVNFKEKFKLNNINQVNVKTYSLFAVGISSVICCIILLWIKKLDLI